MNLKLQFNLSFKFYLVLFITLSIISISTHIVDGSFLSLFSALCAVLYVFFAGAGKTICFIFGILYSISYAYIAYELKLYGDVMLNLFYLPINIYGIYNWKNNQNKEKTKIIITKLNNTQRLIYTFIMIISTIIYAYILKILIILTNISAFGFYLYSLKADTIYITLLVFFVLLLISLILYLVIHFDFKLRLRYVDLDSMTEETKSKVIKEIKEENKEKDKRKILKDNLLKLINLQLYSLIFFELVLVIHCIFYDRSQINNLINGLPVILVAVYTIYQLNKQ